MEDKPRLNTDFEKFIRQELQKTNIDPDESTWANIAAQQNHRNHWLQIRHYGIRVLPLIAGITLAIIGWHYHNVRQSAHPKPFDTKAAPQEIAALQAPDLHSMFPANGGYMEHKGSGPVNPRPLACAPYHERVKNIPATKLRFAAEDGFRYENPATGTEVHIPANALKRANGDPVQGEVEFELREYRNMAEFAASGIPMHYADERGSFFFNSGGMFDVRVNQNGEALQLIPGQACDVRFRSTHQLTQPSLFYFDESANTWGYQPAPAFDAAVPGANPLAEPNANSATGLPPIVDEKVAIRDNLGLPAAQCLPPQTVLPAGAQASVWVKEAVQLGYDWAFGKISVPAWFQKNAQYNNETLLNGMERSLVRLVRHRDARDNFFPEDLNNVFTELQAFKNCYFICNADSLNRKSFSNADLDAYWERVSVVQQQGSACYVSFFGKQGLLQFYATLIGSTGNNNFDADKVMAEYRRLQLKRQQDFEAQANTWRRFLAVSPAFQTPEEWCMESNEWLDYFEANLPLMRKRYAALVEKGIADNDPLALKVWKDWINYRLDTKFDIFQSRTKPRAGLEYTLRVTNFGLHNCDQIFRLAAQPVYLMAKYQTADGQSLTPTSVSILERQTRLFFSLPKANDMVYIPGRQIDVLMTDTKGRFYRLSGEAYARLNLKNQSVYTFQVEDITDKTQTPRAWATLLEI